MASETAARAPLTVVVEDQRCMVRESNGVTKLQNYQRKMERKMHSEEDLRMGLKLYKYEALGGWNKVDGLRFVSGWKLKKISQRNKKQPESSVWKPMGYGCNT